jgi:hypothetical protein
MVPLSFGDAVHARDGDEVAPGARRNPALPKLDDVGDLDRVHPHAQNGEGAGPRFSGFGASPQRPRVVDFRLSVFQFRIPRPQSLAPSA